MKLLTTLAIAAMLCISVPAMANDVFHNVTVTSATGEYLTGAPTQIKKVKVKNLEWLGNNYFQGKVKGQNWFFKADHCNFTLPCGSTIHVVSGPNALGEDVPLVGISPKGDPWENFLK